MSGHYWSVHECRWVPCEPRGGGVAETPPAHGLTVIPVPREALAGPVTRLTDEEVALD